MSPTSFHRRLFTLFLVCPPSSAIQMRRDSKTQLGKHIQIGIICSKYCQVSDCNLRMVILSSSKRCCCYWTATRTLHSTGAPGMRTAHHAIGRDHTVRVGPKRTSIITSNDGHTFAMALNAGLIIGRYLYGKWPPFNLLIILFWFDSHAAFYSSEDLNAHQTRGTHVQCPRWYVSRLCACPFF